MRQTSRWASRVEERALRKRGRRQYTIVRHCITQHFTQPADALRAHVFAALPQTSMPRMGAQPALVDVSRRAISGLSWLGVETTSSLAACGCVPPCSNQPGIDYDNIQGAREVGCSVCERGTKGQTNEATCTDFRSIYLPRGLRVIPSLLALSSSPTGMPDCNTRNQAPAFVYSPVSLRKHSHAQPLPNRLLPAARSAVTIASKLPNDAAIRAFSSGDMALEGSAGDAGFGRSTFQNSAWLKWPPPLFLPGVAGSRRRRASVCFVSTTRNEGVSPSVSVDVSRSVGSLRSLSRCG